MQQLMAKRTIKLNIKLPAGINASEELEIIARDAANAAIAEAVREFVEVQKLAKNLSAQGIIISAEELLSKKIKGPKINLGRTSTGRRRRVVLSDTKRENVLADLDKGMKTAEAARKYGVSIATISNIRRRSGHTQNEG